MYFSTENRHESKYKNGLVHNFLFLIRYAKDKEATAVVSAMLPSDYLRNTDIYVNVTVPSFGSCTVHVKATEQKSNQYFVSKHIEDNSYFHCSHDFHLILISVTDAWCLVYRSID